MKRNYPVTFYTVLGLPPSSSYQLLHARWRALSAQWHPDRVTGYEWEYRELQEAWATLKDTVARARYDAQLIMGGGACVQCDGAGVQTRTLSFTRQEKVICAACEGTGRRAV
jgi:DnaJ-class molecular chaperone